MCRSGLVEKNRFSYYFAVFLRLAKNKPAAAIMMMHPPMVKIVVPIPPVDGKEDSLVFLISWVSDTSDQSFSCSGVQLMFSTLPLLSVSYVAV